MQQTVALRLLHGEHEEMQALQRVLQGAPTYAERITGAPPGRADAQSLYSALPPGKGYEDKFVFGIFAGDEMIGCADLIRGFPDANTALLGLLLLAERHHGKGFGKAAYREIERFVMQWGDDWRRIRIGVVGTNRDVIAFWTKLGFVPTGEAKPYRYANVASDVTVFVKALAAG